MDTKKWGLFQRLFGKPQPAPDPPAATEQAVSDMRLLSGDVGAFVRLRQEWCDEMDFADFGVKETERQEETLLLFAYWLAGYAATDDPTKDPKQFGAYIDWKEETDDIVGLLGDADKNLGYGLCLDEIKFDYTEFTDKALKMTDDFLSEKGLALCALDTQSDSYHLFVLRDKEFTDLQRLSERIGFRFYRDFV
jgi:hypothetical protein